VNVTIRQATKDDAAAIETLEREFTDYLVSIGDTNPQWLSAETYLKEAFGADPAFSGLVAELEGAVIGYVLYHPGYDVDRGGRVLHVIDLFVTAASRRKGVGRALMEATADICRRSGGRGLLWGVFLKNAPSMSFYEHLGARYLQQEDMTYMYWGIKKA